MYVILTYSNIINLFINDMYSVRANIIVGLCE